MDDFPFSLSDVLNLNNIKYNNSSRKARISCPFCSSSKINKNLGVDFETEKFNCFRCNISGRGGTQFHAYLNNMTTKEAYKDIMNSLGLNQSPTDSDYLPRKRDVIEYEQVAEAKLAPEHILNMTYRNLIDILSLTDRDKEDLLSRGFTEVEIKMLGYCSYPSGPSNTIIPEYFDIPKKLIAKDCTLKGVPGFYKTKNKGVSTMAWRKPGILVPYVSYNNNIVGFQLRKHEEELDVDEDGSKEHKYSWFSSPGKLEGCQKVTGTHYACDFEWSRDNLCFSPIITDGIINFTEGAMKADLFHAITGKPIIARPGCGILKDLDKDLLKLKEEKGVHTFCCLYDMDYIHNPHVQKDILKLEEIVRSCGLKYVRPVWNTEINGNSLLKGIDDYYAFLKRGIVPVLKNEQT